MQVLRIHETVVTWDHMGVEAWSIDASRGATPRDHRILPKRIILVRHAESEGNVDNFAYTYVPDPQVPLVSQEDHLCALLQHGQPARHASVHVSRKIVQQTRDAQGCAGQTPEVLEAEVLLHAPSCCRHSQEGLLLAVVHA